MSIQKSFAYAFWSLVLAVFVAAVAVSSTVVWVTSQPYLTEIKRQQTEGSLERYGLLVSNAIEEYRHLLEYLAAEPAVVGYVLGDIATPDLIADRFEGLAVPAGLMNIALFDFEGAPLSARIFGSPVGEGDAPTDTLVDDVLLSAQGDRTSVSAGPESGDPALFRIGVPVRNRGFVEGVMVATARIDIGAILGDSGLTLVSGPRAELPVRPHQTIAPVPETTLALVSADAESVANAAGRELVRRNMIAIAVVLFAPFAAFGLVGRSLLVKPHLLLKASRDALREQQRELKSLAAIASSTQEAIVVTDLDERILWTNPAFERLTGRRVEDVLGQRPASLLQGPETDPETRAVIRAAIEDRRPIQCEIINYCRDGRRYWVLLSITPLRDENGDVYGFMSAATDISETKRQAEELGNAAAEIERQALHDALTGLPNRRHFEIEFRKALERNLRVTLIRIDLDHFKYVNDTHGHEAGDTVLREVGNILRSNIRNGELPVRIGGDEFVIMMTGENSRMEAEGLARRLQECIRQPIPFDCAHLRVGASFGIASSNDPFVTTEVVLRAADAALYKAKDAGRNAVCYYSEQVHAEVTSTRHLSAEIRRAVRGMEFLPYYQPQFVSRTGRLAGLEVLVRWNHPERGILGPSEFLATAAHLSLLGQIDSQIMSRAMADMAALHAAGLAVPKIGFNITADRLVDPMTLIGALESSVPGMQVAFEILESVFLEDQADAIDLVFDLLREYGISIEIDDFGSGHASIVSLMRMRPDALKIDQRLIQPLPQSRRHRDLVASLISLARSLGVAVTAEGVETERHAALLAEMGAETLQGFHLASPMPLEALEDFLKSAARPRADAARAAV